MPATKMGLGDYCKITKLNRKNEAEFSPHCNCCGRL